MSVGPKSVMPASAVDRSIEAATGALLALQRPDGHWVFELEADATIPAEYVLLRHYLAEPVDAALEAKIAAYLRRIQGDHGGWPLFHDGAFDMSASVKAYFALKMIGDAVDAAAHDACARSDPLARRRIAGECVHAADAGAVRVHPLARRSGDAGRDHAAAELVSVPSRQDFLLEPHRHRAAVGAAGAQAEGAQPQGRQHRRAVPRVAADDRAGPEGAAAESLLVLVVPRGRFPAACVRAAIPEAAAATRDRARGRHGSPSASTAKTVSARFSRRWRTA